MHLSDLDYIDDLEKGHVIRILVNEHRIILDHLTGLDEIRQKIFALDSPIDHPEYFVKLIHLTEHLLHVNKHHQREEVLFDLLSQSSAENHIKVLTSEHDFLAGYKQKFSHHIHHLEDMDFKSYKLQMNYMSNGIIGILREHIYLENLTVFPNALKALSSAETWADLRIQFDEIGYYFEKVMLF